MSDDSDADYRPTYESQPRAASSEEASDSPASRNARKRGRQINRVHDGASPSRSNNSSPEPRLTAKKSRLDTADFYKPGGLLDSQIGEQTFIARLFGLEQGQSHGQRETAPDSAPEADRIKNEECSQAPIPEYWALQCEHEALQRADEEAQAYRNKLKAIAAERDDLRDECARLSDENHILRQSLKGVEEFGGEYTWEVDELRVAKEKRDLERKKLKEEIEVKEAALKKWRKVAFPVYHQLVLTLP
uniref:Uncharacterized protein n=1 Tax=Mycena chlorophos TaxID=658473 RepID=A0ABQ0L4F9_MYCCL|nr:predicted protein [Mycena chlorophos]